MERIRAIIKQVSGFRPPLLPCCLMAVLFGTAALWIVVGDLYDRLIGPVIYAIYICAGVFLFLAAWAICLAILRSCPKTQMNDLLHRWEFTARLADDYYFRTIAFMAVSQAVNFAFAMVKGAVGWRSGSFWLITYACYYFLLCVVRVILLWQNHRLRKLEDETARMEHEWASYRACGVILIMMTVVLEGVVVLIMLTGDHFEYSGYLIYAVALYDFFCLFKSIRYMFTTRKHHSPLIASVKTVSFEASLVSILSLQTAMFASFGEEMAADMQNRMNLATGSVVCILTLGMGIAMVWKSGKGRCRNI